MRQRELKAPHSAKNENAPSIIINDFILLIVMPTSCITNCNEPSLQIAANTQSIMVVLK
jgi:hypothetical protein